MVPIIFVCKYRKHLLVSLNTKMKGILYGISDKSDFSILEMEVDKIHVHILVESEPKISVLQIVSRLKQGSTGKIWEEAFLEGENILE